ncbi:unnamed protein product [Closterium sp. Yama58-4]|nr:unnamed protein product [Closterium sp. Yama58-4]
MCTCLHVCVHVSPPPPTGEGAAACASASGGSGHDSQGAQSGCVHMTANVPCREQMCARAFVCASTAPPPSQAKVRRHVQALVVDPDMTVKVHKGDTLWGLAHKYQVPVDALRSANPEVRGDQVLAGSRLFIPNVISNEEFDVRANEE